MEIGRRGDEGGAAAVQLVQSLLKALEAHARAQIQLLRGLCPHVGVGLCGARELPRPVASYLPDPVATASAEPYDDDAKCHS